LFLKNLVHMKNPPNPKKRRPDKLRTTASAVFFLVELSPLEAARVTLERLVKHLVVSSVLLDQIVASMTTCMTCVALKTRNPLIFQSL
jgi:hypothetical protein